MRTIVTVQLGGDLDDKFCGQVNFANQASDKIAQAAWQHNVFAADALEQMWPGDKFKELLIGRPSLKNMCARVELAYVQNGRKRIPQFTTATSIPYTGLARDFDLGLKVVKVWWELGWMGAFVELPFEANGLQLELLQKHTDAYGLLAHGGKPYLAVECCVDRGSHGYKLFNWYTAPAAARSPRNIVVAIPADHAIRDRLSDHELAHNETFGLTEVAVLLDLPYNKVYRQVQDGEIATIKEGKHRVVPRWEWQRLIGMAFGPGRTAADLLGSIKKIEDCAANLRRQFLAASSAIESDDATLDQTTGTQDEDTTQGEAADESEDDDNATAAPESAAATAG